MNHNSSWVGLEHNYTNHSSQESQYNNIIYTPQQKSIWFKYIYLLQYIIVSTLFTFKGCLLHQPGMHFQIRKI